jgi:hypothetical protein
MIVVISVGCWGWFVKIGKGCFEKSQGDEAEVIEMVMGIANGRNGP